MYLKKIKLLFVNMYKYEYAIWGNPENILRASKSTVWFFDGTYHHPEDFSQLFILMY